jgi:apolipoprotein N-acyltransferase
MRAERSRCLLEIAAALLLGGAYGGCFGHPRWGGAAVLLLALFTALLWRDAGAAWRRRARRGAGLGLAFGVGTFTVGVWWLYISMAVYGGLPAWLAAGAVVLFSAYLALYTAASAALAAALAPPASRAPWPLTRAATAAAALAGAWTLGELARGTVFTGFPWLALGYAQSGDALAGYAPLLGLYGVTFAAALSAALLATLTQVSVRGAAAAVALLAALVGGARLDGAMHWTHPTGAPLSVALLQGDVGQSEKFRPQSLAPTLALYGHWLGQLRADLIVTPETALPVLPEDLPAGWLDQLQRSLRTRGAHALVGIPLTRGADQYTNSVLGLGDATRYRYDKAHLVPFGEFIPWGFHWFLRLMNMPLGDFARGGFNQPSFVVDGARVAPTICYEDLFGEQLAQRFRDPAAAPGIIANLTNLGWFGDTVVLGQHLEIARMRSLEFQLPTIRATNTGATAIIDADGHVRRMLAPYTVGVLSGTVQARRGITPFAWAAARLGYAPQLLLCLLALAPAALRRRRIAAPSS